MGWVGEEEVLARRRDGQAAEGGEASWTEIASAAMRAAWVVDNVNAKAVALEEAYDRRSDAIFAATGKRPINPNRRGSLGAIEAGLLVEDPFAAYQRELDDLARDHPDKLDVIRPDVSPHLDALADKVAAERDLEVVKARWRGVWGGGAIASFAGGMAGSLRDPVQTVTSLLGPTGRAGNGLKGLAWMAAKQGVANAGVEVAFQPVVASWRREGGPGFDLGYDASTFAANVGGAFALGGALDLGVRGAFRAVQGVRGRVPILDDAGGVSGWETPEASLERAARKSTSEMLRKAADLDEAALKQLTRETPLANDPMMRALWEQYDDLKATSTRAPGVAEAVDDAASLQAMRAMLDPAEPPPAPVRADPQVVYKAGDVVSTDYATAARQDAPVEVITVPPDRADEVQVAADGSVRVPADLEARPVEPGLAEARQALIDGTLSEHEAAALIRERPEVLDASVPVDTGFLREARAVARLSDAAFDMVMQGEARPEMGALVHDLVPDPARHAGILRQLEDLRPQTPAEARQAIGVLMRETAEPRLVADGGGIDDVHGKDGQKQIEALERQLGLAPAADPTARSAGAVGGPAREPPLGADTARRDSPEMLSVDAFRDAAKLGVLGPSMEDGFTRIKRGRVEPRKDEVLRGIDNGLNYGYSTDDIAHYTVHVFLLENDPHYSQKYTGDFLMNEELREQLRNGWSDQQIDAAYYDMLGRSKAAAGIVPMQPAIVADPPPLMTAMAHPSHPGVTLPVNPDGTVTFWRLGKPHKGEKGNYWTSSRAQVEAYAQRAPGREIVRLDVKPEDLADIAPFGASTGRVAEGETFFVVPREASVGTAKVVGEMRPSAEETAQMRADAAEARRVREPQAGMRVDPSGLPETPRSPPAGAPRQSFQDTAGAARVLQGNARKIVTAMRREGVDGVEKALVEMGPAGARDAAARLAGDMVREFADMAPRARAALLGARALSAVADEMDSIRGGGGGEMRSAARDLEARARAGDVAGSGLGREVTHFERVLRAVETRGKVAVERELELMGKPAARELAERLLPGRTSQWDELTLPRQADLLTRALLSGRMAMSEARRQSIEGQALKGAAEDGTDISLRSMLDDADALAQLADLIRECKL